MNNQFIEINYEKIKKQYDLALVDQLRDFGSNHLKLWVPDSENIIISILNLIYSLHQSNYLKINIKINKYKDLIDIEKLFQKFCNCEIVKKHKYQKIIIDNINERKLILFTNNFTKSNIKKEDKKNISNRKKIEKKEIKKNFLKKNYFKRNKTTTNFISENFFLEKNNFNYIGTYKNFKIGIKIDKKIITNVKFTTNSKNNYNKFILDNFCTIINKLSVQEACEHGVIKLEYYLRPKNLNKIIKGIIPAYVLKKEFSVCKNLMKSIWKKYIKDNPKISKNFFDLKPHYSWLKLNQKEKMNRLNQCIKIFEKQNKLNNLIKFEELNNDIKLTVLFNKTKKSYEKSIILLKLEKFIRLKIDKRIEVFYKEAQDSNKLRAKNINQYFLN